jgi:hypothetical protein
MKLKNDDLRRINNMSEEELRLVTWLCDAVLREQNAGAMFEEIKNQVHAVLETRSARGTNEFSS